MLLVKNKEEKEVGIHFSLIRYAFDVKRYLFETIAVPA